jgi:hypothetical protein
MLLWEGGILIASLVGGGLALFRARAKRTHKSRNFRVVYMMPRRPSPVFVCKRKPAGRLRGFGPNPLLDRLLGIRCVAILAGEFALSGEPEPGQIFAKPIGLSSSSTTAPPRTDLTSVSRRRDVFADARA